MGRIPTIYDVAEHAQVSITTVSRFLNNPVKVAAATREKIEKAMNALDFVPKADAAARARKSTMRIGVMTPSLTAQSFVQRFAGIHETLRPYGYEMITYVVDSREQLDMYMAMLPVSGRVDGLIVLALPIDDEDVERFAAHRTPLVAVEQSHPKVSRIIIDDVHGGALAAAYLVGRGCHQLGFIGVGDEKSISMRSTEKRLDGFRDKLSVLGYPLDPEFVRRHPYGGQESYECCSELLSSAYRPDALFCASDEEAIAALRAAVHLGLKVPEDLAILGFDDIETTRYMEISTIRQSLFNSGSLAASLIASLLRDIDQPVKEIRLELNIVERHTT